MFRAVVLFCAVLALTKGQTTQVSKCVASSAGPPPINAYIAGCDTQPCLLPQGQDAVIHVLFRAPYVIQRMRTVAVAFLGILPITYGLGEQEETCNYLNNTKCPVARDEEVEYTLNMRIEEFMPEGAQLPVEFRIMDDNNVSVMCIRVQVRIMPPVDRFGAQNATLTVEV